MKLIFNYVREKVAFIVVQGQKVEVAVALGNGSAGEEPDGCLGIPDIVDAPLLLEFLVQNPTCFQT